MLGLWGIFFPYPRMFCCSDTGASEAVMRIGNPSIHHTGWFFVDMHGGESRAQRQTDAGGTCACTEHATSRRYCPSPVTRRRRRSTTIADDGGAGGE